MRTGVQQNQPRAFTLLEVLLAIVIAMALFGVAFYLYQQAAELRSELLTESERVGLMRLVLDRMTADLRAAQPDDIQGFNGTSNSLQFVKLGLPQLGLPLSTNVLAGAPDLKVVSYDLISALEGTNITVLGLNRLEQSLGEANITVATNLSLISTNEAAMGVDEALPSTNTVEGALLPSLPEPLTDVIRRLGFRYWDGKQWLENWSDTVPPKGIEITLSPDASEGLEETGEIFRRVIFIPSGSAQESAEPSSSVPMLVTR